MQNLISDPPFFLPDKETYNRNEVFLHPRTLAEPSPATAGEGGRRKAQSTVLPGGRGHTPLPAPQGDSPTERPGSPTSPEREHILWDPTPHRAPPETHQQERGEPLPQAVLQGLLVGREGAIADALRRAALPPCLRLPGNRSVFLFPFAKQLLKRLELASLLLVCGLQDKHALRFDGAAPWSLRANYSRAARPGAPGQRAGITGSGRPSPVPGVPGPALSAHRQAETSRERRERRPQAPSKHLGPHQGVLGFKAQRWCLLSLTKRVARALLHSRS